MIMTRRKKSRRDQWMKADRLLDLAEEQQMFLSHDPKVREALLLFMRFCSMGKVEFAENDAGDIYLRLRRD